MARKRGQNEGTIYQRKDGLWIVQVTIQNKRISKYFKSQAECREWLRNTQSQIQNGLTLSGARIASDFANQSGSVMPRIFTSCPFCLDIPIGATIRCQTRTLPTQWTMDLPFLEFS
jgi:hypothetical protein